MMLSVKLKLDQIRKNYALANCSSFVRFVDSRLQPERRRQPHPHCFGGRRRDARDPSAQWPSRPGVTPCHSDYISSAS